VPPERTRLSRIFSWRSAEKREWLGSLEALVTLEELNKQLDDAEIRARSVLVSNLFDEEFLAIAQQGPAFHDTLVRAQDNGWIHYTRLAEALDLSASQVNRWFKPSSEDAAASRSTPNKFTIAAALKELCTILEADIARLRLHQRPVGGQHVNRTADGA